MCGFIILILNLLFYLAIPDDIERHIRILWDALRLEHVTFLFCNNESKVKHNESNIRQSCRPFNIDQTRKKCT